MKTLSITIKKERIYADMDALTFKKVDASMVAESDRTQNAVSSDSNEEFDRGIIDGYIQDREASLRLKLAFCLVTEEENSVSNEIQESFSYDLILPEGMPNVVARGLAEKMHQYIVRGALHDWYAGQGVASPYSEEYLENRISAIVGTLRGGFIKRPLQPFGPRK